MKLHPVLVMAVGILALGVARVRAESASSAADPDAAFARCAKVLRFGGLNPFSGPSKEDAVHALGLLGDERAVPLLVEHLENEGNDHLRLQIVRALGWLGSASAVPALEKALADKYPFVREQSAAALKKITGRDYEFDPTGLPRRDKVIQGKTG